MSDHDDWMRDLASAVNNCSPDADHPTCPECGSMMNFYGHDDSGDFSFGDGYWECPNCNFSVTEDDLN